MDEEIVKDFVMEGLDLLDIVEPKLIALKDSCENTGEVDSETINFIFRLFHSIKGGAGFLDLPNITALTHSAENLLDVIRGGKTLFNAIHVDVIFRSLDLLRCMLGQVVITKQSDNGFETQVEDLVAEINDVIQNASNSSPDTSAQTHSDTNSQTSTQTSFETSSETITEPTTADDSEDMEFADLDDALDTSDMLDDFIKEADDLVDCFERALLDSTENNDLEPIHRAFRAIHSLKGNCGFMGLADLGLLAHKIENVLQLIKDGVITESEIIIGYLFNCVSLMQHCLLDISKGGKGQIANIEVLAESIDEFAQIGQNTKAPASCKPQDETKTTAATKVKAEHSEAKATSSKLPPTPAAKSSSSGSSTVVRQDIRVDLKKLDSLINLVGELVIAEAMVTRHPSIASNTNEGVERAIHQLRRVSRDLQSVAMAVRMIPLATTFQKMMRLAHDLSSKSGKKVDLQLLGGETEVDKTVIEQISDPLVHIVRNALDHGLEGPAERIAAGKPEKGTVSIEGRNEGGEVWIIIKDDGRGLNREKIIQKAIAKELIQGDGSEMTDNQVFKLIFEPGFSTADKVTEVSGRGVGMDVVKRDIEKLRGRVDISSTLGKGSTFILRIPLTLAIIEGMLVRISDTCYTLPMLQIRESVRPTRKDITVTPEGVEVVRLRDEFIPVIRLNQVLQRDHRCSQIEDGVLIVTETEKATAGLLVDEILGQQETVVKGLPNYIAKARGISGCTILGDGQVSLIIDVSTLVDQAASLIN